ncbi:hypothetical protein CJI53_04045 [Bifidobacteriaceae bacterium VN002]|nr:hypothetical protein CJI53_04045 [Bifidobacteriaceae bacterium VN002]
MYHFRVKFGTKSGKGRSCRSRGLAALTSSLAFDTKRPQSRHCGLRIVSALRLRLITHNHA